MIPLKILYCCCVHLFWCCPDFSLNGIKTGDILLCFNPYICFMSYSPSKHHVDDV